MNLFLIFCQQQLSIHRGYELQTQMHQNQFQVLPLRLLFLPIQMSLFHSICINFELLRGYIGGSGCQGSSQPILVSLSMDSWKLLQTSWKINIMLKLIIFRTANGLFAIAFSCSINSHLSLSCTQLAIDSCCAFGVIGWTYIWLYVLSVRPRQWSMIASWSKEFALVKGVLLC